MTAEAFALTIAGLLAAVLAVPLTNWLKGKWNVDDTSALALTVAVSVVLAFIALLATGALGLASFNYANLPGLVTGVFALATLIFRVLQGKKQ